MLSSAPRFAKVAFVPRTARIGSITPEKVSRWVPSLATWGVGAGALVAFILSATPIFKKDVLQSVPVVSDYFTDKTPDSDKPF